MEFVIVAATGFGKDKRKFMRKTLLSHLREAFLVVLTLSVFAVDQQAAFAQSESCAQLADTLRSLDRNRDFRNLQRNIMQARQLAEDLQDLESLFVRGGCQTQLNNGNRLSGECRTVARRITSGRADYNQLAARIETGQAVDQQRELALQQVARFGCRSSSSSSARVTNNIRENRSPIGNLFDRLFGREGDIIDQGYNFGYEFNSTLRTVCVRACDGYYWPISFSTVYDFLGDDAGLCASQCPGADVELYYYRNPGEDAEDMVNLNGRPYTSLENAFLYRREFNKNCSCKQQIDYGTIVLASNAGDGNQSRTVIEFEDESFPMPMRDPRRKAETIVVAEAVSVPLPRRRPVRPGEARLFPQVVTPTAQATHIRSFQQGDRTVRIVGPDTPYARSAAEGS